MMEVIFPWSCRRKEEATWQQVHRSSLSEMLYHRELLLLALEWIFFETGSGLMLVRSSTQNPQSEQETLTCFRSSDPEAVNATLLYGDHDDETELWSRSPNTSALLPHCSSSSFSPPPAHCEVCRLREVYMICDSLPDGTKLFLERSGSSFQTERSACLNLPVPAGSNRAASPKPANVPPEADGRHRYVLIGPLTLAAILVILAFYKMCKAQT